MNLPLYELYPIDSLQFTVALVPMIYSLTGVAMLDWWSRQTVVISGVDHLGLNPVRLLVMDNMWQHLAHQCCTTVIRDSANPPDKGLIYWIDHIEYDYDMFTLLSCILYLCCIHMTYNFWSIVAYYCLWFISLFLIYKLSSQTL